MDTGRFDFRLHNEFREASAQTIETGGSYVVDLGRTEYIDSSALGMLLILRDRARKSGSTVCVCNCSEAVRRALEMSNLHKIIDIR